MDGRLIQPIFYQLKFGVELNKLYPEWYLHPGLKNLIYETRINTERRKEFTLEELFAELCEVPSRNLVLILELFELFRCLGTKLFVKNETDKRSAMAIVRYFTPCLFSRPFRPGITLTHEKRLYAFVLFTIFNWPSIKQKCQNILATRLSEAGISKLYYFPDFHKKKEEICQENEKMDKPTNSEDDIINEINFEGLFENRFESSRTGSARMEDSRRSCEKNSVDIFEDKANGDHHLRVLEDPQKRVEIQDTNIGIPENEIQLEVQKETTTKNIENRKSNHFEKKIQKIQKTEISENKTKNSGTENFPNEFFNNYRDNDVIYYVENFTQTSQENLSIENPNFPNSDEFSPTYRETLSPRKLFGICDVDVSTFDELEMTPKSNVSSPKNAQNLEQTQITPKFTENLDKNSQIPPKNFSSEISPKNFSSENSPKNFSSEISPKNFSSEISPKNFSSEISPKNFSSEIAPNNFSSEISPKNFSSEISPKNFSSEISPKNFSSEISPKNFSSEISPKNFSSEISPKNFSSENSPKNFSSENSPKNFSSEISPKNFSSEISPKNFSSEIAPNNFSSENENSEENFEISPWDIELIKFDKETSNSKLVSSKDQKIQVTRNSTPKKSFQNVRSSKFPKFKKIYKRQSQIIVLHINPCQCKSKKSKRAPKLGPKNQKQKYSSEIFQDAQEGPYFEEKDNFESPEKNQVHILDTPNFFNFEIRKMENWANRENLGNLENRENQFGWKIPVNFGENSGYFYDTFIGNPYPSERSNFSEFENFPSPNFPKNSNPFIDLTSTIGKSENLRERMSKIGWTYEDPSSSSSPRSQTQSDFKKNYKIYFDDPNSQIQNGDPEKNSNFLKNLKKFGTKLNIFKNFGKFQKSSISAENLISDSKERIFSPKRSKSI